VSPRTRRAVYAFLAVFAITGVAHLEPWPFTGFRLFAELRRDTVRSWQIVAVDGDGRESSVALGDLPIAYRSSSRQIDSFPDLRPAERDAICDAWVGPRRHRGEDIALVRLYAKVESVRPDGPPPVRVLAYECGRSP
jgi:hypothetical protein